MEMGISSHNSQASTLFAHQLLWLTQWKILTNQSHRVSLPKKKYQKKAKVAMPTIVVKIQNEIENKK